MHLKDHELDERQFESQVEDELPDEGQREAGRAVGRYLEGELVRPLMILSSKVNHFALPRTTRPDSGARARGITKPPVESLVAYLYLSSVFSLIINYICQYRYNYYKYHQAHIRLQIESLNQSGSPLDPVQGQLLEELREFVDAMVLSSRADVNRAGGPLREASFSGQFVLSAWICVSFLSYLSSILLRGRLRKLDLYVISASMDWRAERLKMNSLIRQEVNAFIKSSRNFTETIIETHLSISPDLNRAPRLDSNSILGSTVSDYNSTAISLRSMVSDGRLQLINRSPSHLLLLIRFYLYENLFFLSVLITVYPAIAGGLFWFGLLMVKLEYLMDWVCLVQFLSVLSITFVSVCYYMVLLHNGWLDQSKLLEQLERKIRRSIGSIELLHDQLSREDNAKLDVNPRRRLEANEQLLEVLLNYRIFLRQLSQIRFLFDYIALVQLAIMYAPPLLGCIHSPYSSTKGRFLMISWGVYCQWFTLPSIYIVCRFSERCLGLYKSISSLLAHAIGLTAIGQGQLGRFYDQHTIWTLRQELSYPELAKERLAPCLLLVSFTYTNLIRFIFYYGILILSIGVEFDSSNDGSLFGIFKSDPLGVFQPPRPSGTSWKLSTRLSRGQFINKLL